MTFRGIVPYISIVLCFGFIYLLTMLIPNHVLYLGFKSQIPEVEQKMVYQEKIFTYVLSIILLLMNVAEMLSSRQDRFWVRFGKSVFTVVLSYAAGAIIFLLMDTREWNMYLYYRDIPAGFFICVTLGMLILLLGFLQAMRPFLLAKLNNRFVENYIPAWLRFDR